jgi:hypothetical protein
VQLAVGVLHKTGQTGDSLRNVAVVPVPFPFQPSRLSSAPLAIRMKTLISCRRCTEFTIWYPALFLLISQSTSESSTGQ